MTKTVAIDGMKCDGCVKHVTDAFSALPGVHKVSVSLEDKQAIVEGDVSDEALRDSLKDTHYLVTNIA